MSTANRNGIYPRVNVSQDGDAFVAFVELPGVSRDDLEIEVNGRQLHVRGHKRVEAPAGAAVTHREFAGGAFERTLILPVRIDADTVHAELRDGILSLRLERADKPRTIPVEAA